MARSETQPPRAPVGAAAAVSGLQAAASAAGTAHFIAATLAFFWSAVMASNLPLQLLQQKPRVLPSYISVQAGSIFSPDIGQLAFIAAAVDDPDELEVPAHAASRTNTVEA